ncbi:MAG: A/G-specific glycosylase [Acidobacteriaceae bacterium]|nr:A/G-specific glycosylase [Acidobacteriaceae bacterium]
MELRGPTNFRRLAQLRRPLLAWYDQNRRDLPWRASRDPYHIWVSEVMLQQTRVAAVLPRYEKFLRRFPSVQKLASARVTSVLAEWSGLGYYRRARNLHAAAKEIVRERAGIFPQDSETWRKLPGIGRYTAAAIASIAFGEPVAVLDGNVDRVLRRLLGSNSVRESWNAAQQILDRKRPGDFNQAIMELGAMVCVPGEPLCSQCPIGTLCRTRGRGEARTSKPKQRKVSSSFALATRGDSVFLVQRHADESLMPGMWEMPKVESLIRRDEVLFTVRHSITVSDYLVSVIAQSAAPMARGTWVKYARANKLPLTGLATKILRKANIIE